MFYKLQGGTVFDCAVSCCVIRVWSAQYFELQNV